MMLYAAQFAYMDAITGCVAFMAEGLALRDANKVGTAQWKHVGNSCSGECKR